MKRRQLLERFHELSQIAHVASTLDDDVDVIRHHAVGVYLKPARVRDLFQGLNDPNGLIRGLEGWASAVGTKGYEIYVAPQIPVGRQANNFSF